MDEKEAARMLGFSRAWMQYRRYHGGGPPFVKINNCAVRYRVADLEAWIEQFGTRRSTTDETPPTRQRSIPRVKLKPKGLRRQVATSTQAS